MGSLRKVFCNPALLILLQAGSLCAQTSASDPAYLFATCTGRLSALIEHQWLMQDPASARTEEMRDGMLALLDAVAPGEDSARLMGWRIEAKFAQATLLSRASFDRDATAAAWARQRSELLVGQCVALMLGSDAPPVSG